MVSSLFLATTAAESGLRTCLRHLGHLQVATTTPAGSISTRWQSGQHNSGIDDGRVANFGISTTTPVNGATNPTIPVIIQSPSFQSGCWRCGKGTWLMAANASPTPNKKA